MDLTERKYKASAAIIMVIYIVLSVMQFYLTKAADGIVRTIFTEYRLMLLLWLLAILIYIRIAPKVHSMGWLAQSDRINFEALISAIVYFSVRYLVGILLFGLGKSPYSLTFSGIINNIADFVPQLIAKEFTRFYIINTYCNKKRNKPVLYILSVLLAASDFNWNSISTSDDLETLSKLLAKDVLPDLCQSILLSFLALYGSIITPVIYVLTSFIFMWLVPVLPDLNWFCEGVLGTVVPVILISYITTRHSRIRHRENEKHVKEQVKTGIMLTFSVILFWFVVGVFPIYSSVIATGSMEPLIYPGDIIIIDRIRDQDDIDKLNEGDIIQFKRDEILITHRIIAVELDADNKLCFRTKGDNNSAEDTRLVYPEDVRGTLVKVIPKLGYPTLLIKERVNTDIDINEMEF